MNEHVEKVVIYPTLSPPPDKIVYKIDAQQRLIELVDHLYRKKYPLKPPVRKQLINYLQQSYSLEAFAYHLEIMTSDKVLDYQKIMMRMEQEFPQIVWIQLGMNYPKKDKQLLLIEFIPIALIEEAFPVVIQFELFLSQHFLEESPTNNQRFCEQITKVIEEASGNERVKVVNHPQVSVIVTDKKETQSVKVPSSQKKVKQTSEEPVLSEQVRTLGSKNQRQVNPKKNRKTKGFQQVGTKSERAKVQEPKLSTTTVLSANATLQNDISSTAEYLAVQEEAKRERAAKERLRLANQKLEMIIESLELSIFDRANDYLNKTELQEEDKWYTFLKISLKEYTVLFQKAKSLDQLWQINETLVGKVEKMTMTNQQVTYERAETHKMKLGLSSRDIHFVLYECQVIAARVKIYAHPFFRRPYVKIMRMDYDNLLRKAAYFDLLQGESYLLEKTISSEKIP